MLLVDNMKLYICHTHLHILISCAKIVTENTKGDIIICDSIPNHAALTEKIRATGIWNAVYTFEETKTTHRLYKWLRFDRLRNDQRFFRNVVRIFFPVRLKAYSDIYIYNDCLCAGQFIRACNMNYHLIEDGIDYWSAVDGMPEFRYEKNRLYRSIYQLSNNTDNMIDFEVNDKKTIPKGFTANVVEAKKKELFMRISLPQRETISGIFIDVKSIDLLSQSFDEGVLILTQPFWEDNSITVEECNRIYNSISQKYLDEGCFVIVKPHPRDNNEYKCSYMLNKDFPAEIICFTPLIFRISKVVSVNSTGGGLFCQMNDKIVYERIGLNTFYGKCNS